MSDPPRRRRAAAELAKALRAKEPRLTNQGSRTKNRQNSATKLNASEDD